MFKNLNTRENPTSRGLGTMSGKKKRDSKRESKFGGRDFELRSLESRFAYVFRGVPRNVVFYVS